MTRKVSAHVTSLTPALQKYEVQIKIATEKALQALFKTEKEIDIFLVSREFYKQYSSVMHSRGKKFIQPLHQDGFNVLSFPATPSDVRTYGRQWLGEVYLSPDYIIMHNESLALMLIHGLLHCVGFDHIKKGESKKMEKREDGLIALLMRDSKKYPLLFAQK